MKKHDCDGILKRKQYTLLSFYVVLLVQSFTFGNVQGIIKLFSKCTTDITFLSGSVDTSFRRLQTSGSSRPVLFEKKHYSQFLNNTLEFIFEALCELVLKYPQQLLGNQLKGIT